MQGVSIMFGNVFELFYDGECPLCERVTGSAVSVLQNQPFLEKLKNQILAD